jgi:hypothetical protein
MKQLHCAALAICASGCVDVALAQSAPRPSDASAPSIVSPFGDRASSRMDGISLSRPMNGADRAFGPLGLRGVALDASAPASVSIGASSNLGNSRSGTGTAQAYAPGVPLGSSAPTAQRTLHSQTQWVSGDVALEVARRALMRLSLDFSRCFQRTRLPATSPAVHVLLTLEWAPNARSPRVADARGEDPAITACVESLARTARLAPTPARTRSVVRHALEWAAR